MQSKQDTDKCMHPKLAERDHNQIQSKLRAVMGANGLDALILTRPENILYATGYQSVLGYLGGVPAGTVMAVIAPDGTCHLVLSSLEKHAARALTPDAVKLADFPTWVFIDDGSDASRSERPAHLEPFAAAKTALDVIQSSKPDATIGIEAGGVPYMMWNYLTENGGETTLKDASGAIMQSRMVKTPWEVDMLRYAAQFTERVMHQVASEAEPGMYPADIDNRMVALGRASDDERMISGQTFIYGFGPYYSLSGTPRHFQLQEGDIVKLDGGFIQLGYISDLARTFAIGGKPSDDSKRVFDALYKGFERGIELIGPGIRYCDLYAEVRRTVEASGVLPSYPRGHMGHSIGVSPILEEFPQISPDCTLEMTSGMVVSFELSYFGAQGAPAVGGFNTEDSFVITEEGHERFTHAPETLVYT